MTTSRLAQILRASASTAFLTMILVGPPVLLVMFVGWPLPTSLSSLDEIQTALNLGIDDRVVVKAVALLGWITWAQVVAAILIETVAAIRGRSAARLPVMPGLQRLVRPLVAGATISIASIGPLPGTASPVAADPVPSEEFAPEHNQPALPVSAGMLTGRGTSDSGNGANGQPAPEAPAGDEANTVEVQRHDSWWAIAERTLDDGTRWRDIRTANVGLTMPDGATITGETEVLQPGWRLVVPTEAETVGGPASASSGIPSGIPSDTRTDRGSAPEPPADPPSAQPDRQAGNNDAAPIADGIDVTVAPGDSLWTIAQRRLAEVLSEPPTDAQTGVYWANVVEAARPQLDDPDNPDLIRPGQAFALPPIPAVLTHTPPAVSTVPPGDEAPREEGSASPDEPVESEADADSEQAEHDEGSTGSGRTTTTSPAPATPPTAPPTSDDAGTVGGVEDAAVPSTTGTTAPPATSTTTSTVAPAAEDNGAAENEGRNNGSSDPHGEASGDLSEPGDEEVSVPAWAVGASGLLAGFALMALARRRRNRRRGLRNTSAIDARPPEDVEAERRLMATAGDVVPRAMEASRALGPAFRQIEGQPPKVTGIVIGPDGSVMVYLDEPTPAAPPFVAHADDAAVWVLDDTSDIGPDAEPVLCTLVALGYTEEGHWLVVDIESLGALHVDGDRDRAARFVRSALAELALQPPDHLMEVTAIGVDPPHETTQPVVAIGRLDEPAAQRIEQIANEAGTCLAEATMEGRSRGAPRDGLIPTVVVAGDGCDSVLSERLSRTALPGGQGIGIISTSPLSPEAAEVVLRADGRMEIPALGLVVTPAELSEENLEQLDRLLADEPDVQPLAGDDWPDEEDDLIGLLHESSGEVVPELDPPSLISPAEDEALGNGEGSEDDAPAVVDETAEVPPFEEPDHEVVVRVYADHQVEQNGEPLSFRYGDNPLVPNKNTQRGPELLTLLAFSDGRAATFEQVAEGLWWGRAVKTGTVDKTIQGTRRVLGGRHMLSHAQGDPKRRYKLSAAVTTDVELFEAATTYARELPATTAGYQQVIDVLRPYLAQVESPPFNDQALGKGLADWAGANRTIERVEQPLVAAALLAAEAASNLGQHDSALWCLDRALQACPTNEQLIRAAMAYEDAAGNRTGVESRYQALATRLAVDEFEPEPETTDLRNHLMRSHHKVG